MNLYLSNDDLLVVNTCGISADSNCCNNITTVVIRINWIETIKLNWFRVE